ncbi:D-2-hydroxyacid dehydrogenase [Chelativorans alearense]|uniref:D-2-hydroxyacid dehydrogenase n=1 Tax=Chelativorans alearense TaxID=2681495 RepID=UPI0013CF892A|nr:D-2-hydroxyacid dehydrogenase [Chelativorans alearense]
MKKRKTVLVRHERFDWSEWYVRKLSPLFPDFEFRPTRSEAEAMAEAHEVNVFVGIGPTTTPRFVAAMPNLEWVQTLTTGVDNLLVMKEMPAHVAITRVAGVHGPQMAELAILLMLSLLRDLPRFLEKQQKRQWDRRPQPLLSGRTVCILGLGLIADSLALYCKTMGMTVVGVSDGRKEAPHVDRIYRRADLKQAAAEADFLVVLVPLSAETRHIINADVLLAMKPSAYLINIARGGCVDENALLDALNKGQIAGAGIDVFEATPLPAESPLWHAPNAIVTPHVGGYADVYHEQCFPIVVENFRVYAQGGPDALKNAMRRQGD